MVATFSTQSTRLAGPKSLVDTNPWINPLSSFSLLSLRPHPCPLYETLRSPDRLISVCVLTFRTVSHLLLAESSPSSQIPSFPIPSGFHPPNTFSLDRFLLRDLLDSAFFFYFPSSISFGISFYFELSSPLTCAVGVLFSFFLFCFVLSSCFVLSRCQRLLHFSHSNSLFPFFFLFLGRRLKLS